MRKTRQTRPELATTLGVSLATVDRLIKAGLTSVGTRGQARTYDVEEARRALAERRAADAPGPLDPRQERARKDRSTSELNELKLATLRGEFIAAVEVQREWSSLIVLWRDALLQLHSRVKGAAPHLTVADLRIIDAEVRRILNQMADTTTEAPAPIAPATPSAAECQRAEKFIRDAVADEAGWPCAEVDMLARAGAEGISDWYVRRTALLAGITMVDGRWERPAPGRKAAFDPEVRAKVQMLDQQEAARRIGSAS